MYQDYIDRADALLEEVSQFDLDEWKKSSLTRSLKLLLQGDRALILDQWSSGAFTSESADGTAQANAKALGELHAIERVLEHIEELELTEYDKTSRVQDSG